MKNKTINEIQLYQRLHEILGTTSPKTTLIIDIDNYNGDWGYARFTIERLVDFIFNVEKP